MPAVPEPSKERRRNLVICIAIFLIALGIRLTGIGWGLKDDLHNQSFHPDESLIFDFVHKSHLVRPPGEREYYNYGTLYYAIVRSFDAIGTATGNIKPPAKLLRWNEASPQEWDDINTFASQSILWGRIASAIAGAATAALIFLVLARWTTLLGSLAGGALVALSPAHVEHSRFQTVDVISLFFVTLASLACLRMLRPELEGKRQWMLEVCVAAALAGFAGSTRYSDILLVLPVWTVLAVRRPQNWGLMAVVAGFVAVAAFVITTPGSVTDTAYFLANQRFQASHANEGHGLVFVGRPSGFIFQIYELMMGMTVAAVVIGLAGLLYAAYRRHAWAWVILAYFIPYYITIGILHVMFLRYGFPLYLGVAVGFGYAISCVQRRWNSSLLAGGLAFLAIAGLESPQAGLRGVALFTEWMTQEDPRDEAGHYLANIAKLDPTVDVGVFSESPYFWDAAIIKDEAFLEYEPARVKRAYLATTHGPKVTSLLSGALPAYVTFSSYQVEDALRLRGRNDIDPESAKDVDIEMQKLEAIRQRYRIAAEFGGDGPTIHDLEYIRPTIYVLKRNDLP